MTRIKLVNNYQYTGNSVPISALDTSAHVIALLEDYDRRMNEGINPSINPYKDRIVMTTQEGRMIEIPQDIQEDAIQQWVGRSQTRRGRTKGLNTDRDMQNMKESFLLRAGKIVGIGIILIVIIYLLFQSRNIRI